MEPTKAAAASLKNVSEDIGSKYHVKLEGRRVSCMAALSTYMCSSFTEEKTYPSPLRCGARVESL